jgi:hypothetical protein
MKFFITYLLNKILIKFIFSWKTKRFLNEDKRYKKLSIN